MWTIEHNVRVVPAYPISSLVSHRRWLEAVHFRFVEESYYRVAKAKALISFAITAKLFCAFILQMQNAVSLMTGFIQVWVLD